MGLVEIDADHRHRTATTIGIDLGQGRKPTALCVVQSEDRRRSDGLEVDHYTARFLERLPGASYPAVARRLDEIARNVRRITRDSPLVYVNATGHGEAVVDLLRAEVPECFFWSVYFFHGDRRSFEGIGLTLGKAWLVGRLKILLQADQLHLPASRAAKELARDLHAYEVRVTEDANTRYGAFTVGHHDDLVNALGLAVQEPEHRSWVLRSFVPS